MSNLKIEFLLNSNDKIVIDLDESLDAIDCCYRLPIYLVHTNKKIIISKGTIYFDIDRLRCFLKKALKGEFKLHPSITENIGYIHNEYHQDESKFMKYKIGGILTWAGYKYRLWEAFVDDKRFIIWMYNDHNDDIIFEVTPFYPYLFCEPNDEENYIPYYEWIKDYKPYFVAKISKGTAQKWLDKATDIIEQIDSNVEKWKSEKVQDMS